MYDCQRRFLYLIIIIYLIIYISARVIPYRHKSDIYRRKSDIYKRKKGHRLLHRRHNESLARQGNGQTGGSQGAEGRGAVGGEYCKKTGRLCGFFRFYVYLCPMQRWLRLPPTSSPRAWRYRRRRSDNSAGGRDYAPGRRDYAPGHRDYASWSPGLCARPPGLCARSPGLCARSPGARTKDKRYI